MRIVRATEARMPEVAKVYRASFEHAYPEFPSLHSIEEDLFFFKNVVFEKNTIYVAERINPVRVLGFVALNFYTIEHLYVAPEVQRMGLGSQLLAHAQAQAKENGRAIRLWVFRKNLQPLEFFRKRGFTVIQETDGSTNEYKQPDILLEWSPR